MCSGDAVISAASYPLSHLLPSRQMRRQRLFASSPLRSVIRCHRWSSLGLFAPRRDVLKGLLETTRSTLGPARTTRRDEFELLSISRLQPLLRHGGMWIPPPMLLLFLLSPPHHHRLLSHFIIIIAPIPLIISFPLISSSVHKRLVPPWD